MILDNDWLTTNVRDIDADQTISRVIGEYVPGDFEESSFMDAATKIANTIKNKYEHIYVTYSGGQDSEFCFNILHEVGANPIPIHIRSYFTEESFADGIPNLKEKDIEPIIIDCGIKSGEAFIDLYKDLIVSKYPWILAPYHIFQLLLSAKEMKKHHPNGILISGGSVLNGTRHNQQPSGLPRFHINGYEQGINLYEEGSSILPLLYYNQHIMYETMRYVMPLTGPREDDPKKYRYTTEQIKADLYKVKYRVKKRHGVSMRPEHVNLFNKLVKKIPVNNKGYIEQFLFKQKGSDDTPKPLLDVWRSLKR